MKFLLFAALALSGFEKKPTRLELNVIGVAPEKGGEVLVAVYASESDFLKPEKVFKTFRKKVENGQNRLVFDLDLDLSEAAIAVFQDENGDQKLSTNWLGIPVEAYGFSNNVRPKFRAATWAEAKIDLSNGSKTAQIRLEKW